MFPMRCVSDWSIRRQLTLAFVGVLIPYFFLGAFATSGFWRVLESLSEVYTEATVELDAISRLRLALDQIHESVGRWRVTPHAAERAAVERDLALFQTARNRLEGVIFHDPEEREGLARTLTASSVIEGGIRQFLLPRDPAASARQEEVLARLHEAMDTASAALNRIEVAALREMTAARTKAYDISRRTLAWMMAAAGLSVAGGVVLALVFSWRINRSLLALAAGSQRVAEGDLAVRVSVESGSELRRTANAFNYMAEQLATSKQALADQIRNIEEALAQVKQLKGLLPICASCKRIRDDRGYWSSVEEYLQEHTDAEFSHGICPPCLERLYPWYKGRPS